MSMDIAMGGSTNTILHLLAAAFEGDVPFTIGDIDRLSRRVPHLCKVSPSTSRYHVEDVHRAGGVIGILAEMDRARLLDTSVKNVLGQTLGDTIAHWDVMRNESEEVRDFYLAAPGRRPSLRAFTQDARYDSLDLDRAAGCIRDEAHAYSRDGGLAVLHGNLARDGCIVKTAGVDPALLTFTGRARVFESENDTAAAIQSGAVKPGDVVVVRYEGPRGGPGMQEMLMPTSLIKAVGLASVCALVTDGRFSGASSGLSVGHVSPEAAEGGEIALVADGDEILIDIPNRTITLVVSDDELAQRRATMLTRGAAAWSPRARKRQVSRALRAYAALARSASHGAVRDPSLVESPTSQPRR
jgi:dihydroxy-acid dehydratase